MDRDDLYAKIAARKFKQKDMEPYAGDNGRVNKCVGFMRSGKIKTGGRLVDVGGGIGDLGYAARDLFEERFVLDISSRNTESARVKGNVTIICDVDREGIPLGNMSTDVVAALDFIEHIVDPENFARECKRVLKSSGEVFVNTPNIRFWRHIERLRIDGRFPHTSGDRDVYHGGHLAFYTYSDLCEIFESCGFSSAEQLKDEECYEEPPARWIQELKPKNQQDYLRLLLEFGCPNLLYKAVSVR